MLQTQLITEISSKVKASISQTGPIYCFDFSYWKGYCNAIESVNGIGTNDIYVPVKVIALEFIDKLRNGEPVAGIC